MGTFLSILLMLTGFVLCFIILIQRGRGGGLVGALGGGGGSSAFGSRAGDTFTKITIGIALLWIVLNMGMNIAVQPDIQARVPTTDNPTGGGTGGGVPTGTAPAKPTSTSTIE